FESPFCKRDYRTPAAFAKESATSRELPPPNVTSNPCRSISPSPVSCVSGSFAVRNPVECRRVFPANGGKRNKSDHPEANGSVAVRVAATLKKV
ncbi:hypothetical protein K0M31_014469, partial [Melipona bicolor]